VTRRDATSEIMAYLRLCVAFDFTREVSWCAVNLPALMSSWRYSSSCDSKIFHDDGEFVEVARCQKQCIWSWV